MNLFKIRLTGILTLIISGWYLEWLVRTINLKTLYLSVPFVLTSILLEFITLISVINVWNSLAPKKHLWPVKKAKDVAIIIPTWSEPIEMVINTAKSVLDQNWPQKNIILVITDDAHNLELHKEIIDLQKEYPKARVLYNNPPFKGSKFRNGEGKAGNLNSGLVFVQKKYPNTEYIETRDADDLVGNKNFLRHCIGQLEKDPDASYVQTIKECMVSAGDPFGNQEAIFYRNDMLAKNAAGASFPCGSGLVWRKSHLLKIEGFPSWNLVEDLQSGYDILQRGGKCIYLPIVGAVGQIAPEDIPNLYKQRGTWAIDSLRIFLWRNPLFAKGLSITQKLQFLETGSFYLLGMVMMVFIACLSVTLLFGIYPVSASVGSYSVHFWLYMASMELFLVVKASGLTYESLWSSRKMWLGLSPVYFKSLILALMYGPHKKPSYKVTRKTHQYGWYWKETLPQTIMILFLLLGVVSQTRHIRDGLFDYASTFWALFFAIALTQIVRNSWFGLDWKKEILARVGTIFAPISRIGAFLSLKMPI